MSATIAIMQPYLFPYLGYFQLAAAVEKFVFYDDVNYICGGWINRNRINLNGESAFFTVPLAKASSFRKINEIKVVSDRHWKDKIFRTLRHAYGKAPFFPITMPLFEDVLDSNEAFIGEIAKKSIIRVASLLGLKTVFISTSANYNNSELSGAARVIDICRLESADCYINLAGGKALYHTQYFSSHQVTLRFLSPGLQPLKQVSERFLPGLSIIDLLMYYDIEAIREMLSLATLESPCAGQGKIIRNGDCHVQ